MGNSTQMQTPANKEKDACKKPQPVSTFRLNQINWAKIIKCQLNKPHILGASQTVSHLCQLKHTPDTTAFRIHTISLLNEGALIMALIPVALMFFNDCGITESHNTFLFRSFRSLLPQFCSVVSALPWGKGALAPFCRSCSALCEG